MSGFSAISLGIFSCLFVVVDGVVWVDVDSTTLAMIVFPVVDSLSSDFFEVIVDDELVEDEMVVDSLTSFGVVSTFDFESSFFTSSTSLESSFLISYSDEPSKSETKATISLSSSTSSSCGLKKTGKPWLVENC